MAVFLLYVAELTQRDTHAHRHTYTNRPNGREREWERERESSRQAGRARAGHQLPYHVFTQKSEGAAAAFAGSENKIGTTEDGKLVNQGKKEYDKLIR